MSTNAPPLDKEGAAGVIAKVALHLETIEGAAERMTVIEQAVKDVQKATRDADLARVAEHERSLRPVGTDRELYQAYMVNGDMLEKDRTPETIARSIYNSAENLPMNGQHFIGRSGEGPNQCLQLLGGIHHGIHRWGLLDDPEPKTEWQGELQRLASLRALAINLGKAGGRIGIRGTPMLDRMIAFHFSQAPDLIQQVYADNPTEGAEFLIPGLTIPTLIRKAELPRQVAALFGTVDMPTGRALTWPYLVRGVQPFIMVHPGPGETSPAEMVGSVPETDERSMTPQTVGVLLAAYRDAEEDSLFAFGPFAIQMVSEAIRDAREDALMNADNQAAHGDTDLANWNPRGRWVAGALGGTNDHRRWYRGLRHRCLDGGHHADGSTTQGALGVAQAGLKGLGGNHAFGDVVHIVNPMYLLTKLLTDDRMLTIDKIGDRATLLTGQVGSVFGDPVIMSEFLSDEMSDGGIYDGVTTDKTGMISVDRGRFIRGIRREARMEREVVARTNTTYTVLSVREGFMPIDDDTVPSCFYTRNLDTAP